MVSLCYTTLIDPNSMSAFEYLYSAFLLTSSNENLFLFLLHFLFIRRYIPESAQRQRCLPSFRVPTSPRLPFPDGANRAASCSLFFFLVCSSAFSSSVVDLLAFWQPSPVHVASFAASLYFHLNRAPIFSLLLFLFFLHLLFTLLLIVSLLGGSSLVLRPYICLLLAPPPIIFVLTIFLLLLLFRPLIFLLLLPFPLLPPYFILPIFHPYLIFPPGPISPPIQCCCYYVGLSTYFCPISSSITSSFSLFTTTSSSFSVFYSCISSPFTFFSSVFSAIDPLFQLVLLNRPTRKNFDLHSQRHGKVAFPYAFKRKLQVKRNKN